MLLYFISRKQSDLSGRFSLWPHRDMPIVTNGTPLSVWVKANNNSRVNPRNYTVLVVGAERRHTAQTENEPYTRCSMSASFPFLNPWRRLWLSHFLETHPLTMLACPPPPTGVRTGRTFGISVIMIINRLSSHTNNTWQHRLPFGHLSPVAHIPVSSTVTGTVTLHSTHYIIQCT